VSDASALSRSADRVGHHEWSIRWLAVNPTSGLVVRATTAGDGQRAGGDGQRLEDPDLVAEEPDQRRPGQERGVPIEATTLTRAGADHAVSWVIATAPTSNQLLPRQAVTPAAARRYIGRMPAADAELVALARRCWGVLEPLHVIGYFAPETTQAYVELGLHHRLSYFAARSAAMGAVGPELTTATFYVFSPALVEQALPRSWSIAAPEDTQRARRRGVAAALSRVLGQPDVSEALELARTVTEGLAAPGRPLYAAHSDLEWPNEPLLALWHAATLVREFRGDGHVAVLTHAGLDPVESLVLGGLFADNTDFVKRTRGWSDEQWGAGQQRLRARGLLDPDGTLTEEGRTFRQRIEDDTDRLAVGGCAHLGADGTRRLIELVTPLRTTVLASKVLPDWISSRGK
jgi:hypothetical protein